MNSGGGGISSDRSSRPPVGDLPAIIAAAHELKSPLALVRQLSLMLEQGDASPADQARMVRQITLTSEQALRLTTDLTRASRLQATLFELEPVNPQQLCEDLAHELTPLFRAHGKRIIVRPRHRQILAVANRDLLRRILANFSDNALHYAGSDGVVEFGTSLTAGGDQVRVGVRDYGPALPADLWRRTNEPATTYGLSARPQSSGLGLYLAHQFAGAMNAAVGATRHRDGATFYVDMVASRQLSLL